MSREYYLKIVRKNNGGEAKRRQTVSKVWVKVAEALSFRTEEGSKEKGLVVHRGAEDKLLKR